MDMMRFKTHLSLTSACVAALVPALALAQNAAPTRADSSAQAAQSPTSQEAEQSATDGIVVKGVRGSVIRALDGKKRDIRITDSIQAEDLGKFPDTNLADSLQRVPGVSLERSTTGVSRTITVRGLSSQFTRVEINGMGDATGGGGRSARFDPASRNAGNDGRNFSFDVLPSEMFTSAVIAKSPEAHNTEGGIAATVELKTPGPFDMKDQSGFISVQGAWNQRAGVNPRLSAIYSHKFSDTFGVLVGATYSHNDNITLQNGYDKLVPLGTVVANKANYTTAQQAALVPDWTQNVLSERKTDNYTFIGTAEWRPNSDTSFRLDGIYGHVGGTEQQTFGFYRLNSGVAPTNLNIVNGVVQSATYPGITRSEIQLENNSVDDTLQQYTFSGHVGLGGLLGGHWVLSPFAGYNQRVQDRPFQEINAFGAGGTLSYDLSKGPTGFSSSAPGFGSNPQGFKIANDYNSDNYGASHEYDGALNMEGKFDGPLLKAIRFGGRYTAHSTTVAEPFFGALNTSASPTLGDVSLGTKEGYLFGNIPAISSYLLGGQNLLSPSFQISQSKLSGPVIGSVASNQLAQSQVKEKIAAGYIEADFKAGPIDLNGGLRVVSTNVEAIGAQVVGTVVTPVDQKGSYTKVLPSVNAKVNLTDNLFLHGAWSKALSRPSLAALAPRETINFTTLTGSEGNPDLKPFVVNQFDIGAEWYFRPESLLAATYFKKNFSSLIADQVVTIVRPVPNAAGVTSNQPVLFTAPFNTGKGQVEGVEVTFQSTFFFLPKPFQNFGAQFNYTKLKSSVSITTTDANQSQPFPNLSPSSFNASLYYDDGKFDARVNYAWRAGFQEDAVDPLANLPFLESFGQLDMTMNYQLTKHLNFQVQASNLTNEKLRYKSSLAPVDIATIETGRSVVFGARYSF